MDLATFRFKIETTDRVEVTDHALRRYWLRIDPIPDRREVEERIRSEMQRGFWLRRWRMQDGVPVLHCRLNRKPYLQLSARLVGIVYKLH